ncbi:MAG: hypothetical protein GX557_14750, partial [Chloroflexi bacterium]|nr:hypothetical protein [Chloroflexota bacterium]
GRPREDLFTTKAQGYTAPPGSGQILPGAWSYVPLHPVGGIDGTAEDLARLAMALTPPAGEPGPLFER